MGAREYGQARHYARRLLLLNYGFLAVVCTVMVLGAGAIVGIYQLSPEAAAEAQRMITVHSFFMILHPISFTLPNALRASYDAKFTMVVSIFSMWMFPGTSGLLVCKNYELGNHGRCGTVCMLTGPLGR